MVKFLNLYGVFLLLAFPLRLLLNSFKLLEYTIEAEHKTYALKKLKIALCYSISLVWPTEVCSSCYNLC
jgi:hypothetical protein